LATAKATVALSVLSFADVRLTQNLFAMALTLPSADQVDGMLATHEGVTGHPAPRGQISGCAGIERDQLHDLTRLHARE
jgi:hypothetical protein